MDINRLPFVEHVGLTVADAGSGYLCTLPDRPCYGNHIGSIHAGAMMTLSETAAAVFLQRHFSDFNGFVPVVRRFAGKFRKPAHGRLRAASPASPADIRRWRAELAARGRLLLAIPVELVDDSGTTVQTAEVECFIARPQPPA